jgi:ADP-heptose:LPS heptosyltransferase
MPRKFRIGLNWAGNPSFRYDYIRSTRLENLKLLLEVPGVEWFSLHKGHRENEAETFNLCQPLKTAGDFYDTAVFMATLDLVVSTETVTPNISAAMGIPTCVMTSTDASWRWKSWYNSVTLCSQETPGNWYEPLIKVLEIIKEKLEIFSGRQS